MPTNRTRKSRKRSTLPPHLEKWVRQTPGKLTEVEVCELFLFAGDEKEARKVWDEYNPEKPFVDPLEFAEEQERENADESNKTFKK